MLESVINIGKYLQNLFWGFIFSLLLILLIFDTNVLILTYKNIDIKEVSDFGQGILVGISLIVLSIVGLKILDLIILLLNNFFTIIFKISIFRKFVIGLRINHFFKTEGQIAMEVFNKYQDDILKFSYLKSWSQPEVLGSIKGLKSHINEIREHILQLKSDDLMVHIDYHSSVTQEQVRKDQMRNTIQNYYYMIITSSIVLILLILNFNTILITTVLTILFFILFITILKSIHSTKNKLAFYILNGYIDNFTLGQGATVADRDASVD